MQGHVFQPVCQAMARDGFAFGRGWSVKSRLVPDVGSEIDEVGKQLAVSLDRVNRNVNGSSLGAARALVWHCGKTEASWRVWVRQHPHAVAEARARMWVRERKVGELVGVPIDRYPQEAMLM